MKTQIGRILGLLLLLLFIILPNFSYAQSYYWTYKGQTYYKFDDLKSAWQSDILNETNTIYQQTLLRDMTEEEKTYWLDKYPVSESTGTSYNTRNIYDEIVAGDEYSQLTTWRKQATGILLRANCKRPTDEELNNLAKNGQWQTTNAISNLTPYEQSCHHIQSTVTYYPILLISLGLLLVAFILFLLTRRLRRKIKAENHQAGLKAGVFIFGILWRLVALVSIMGLVVFGYSVYQTLQPKPYLISGESMLPTLTNNENIQADTQIYNNTSPARGDIIVLTPPVENETDAYIKRIIGLPGETIEISDGKVYINNEAITEPYLMAQDKTYGDLIITLKADEYLVLGDNREESGDSREFGPILFSDIIGEAILP